MRKNLMLKIEQLIVLIFGLITASYVVSHGFLTLGVLLVIMILLGCIYLKMLEEA